MNHHKHHIILAEDDRNIAEVMKLVLVEEGYTVSVAPDQETLQKLCDTELPQLIFLDVRLGGESGEKIAESLRNNEITATIPIVIVSADNETRNIAARVGADDFLLKPFELADLIAMVKKHLHS